MPYTPNNATMAAVPLGSNSKLYRCVPGSIGDDNTDAQAAAVVCANTSKHAVDPGIVHVPIERAAGNGSEENILGNSRPKLSFSLYNIRQTSGEATEVDTIIAAAINGTPIWLAALDNAIAVGGAQGIRGHFLLKITRKTETQEAVMYEVEAVQAKTTAHFIEWFQITAA